MPIVVSSITSKAISFNFDPTLLANFCEAMKSVPAETSVGSNQLRTLLTDPVTEDCCQCTIRSPDVYSQVISEGIPFPYTWTFESLVINGTQTILDLTAPFVFTVPTQAAFIAAGPAGGSDVPQVVLDFLNDAFAFFGIDGSIGIEAREGPGSFYLLCFGPQVNSWDMLITSGPFHYQASWDGTPNGVEIRHWWAEQEAMTDRAYVALTSQSITVPSWLQTPIGSQNVKP
jgi:hypothetical protein